MGRDLSRAALRRIAVGSANPVKVAAVRAVAQRILEDAVVAGIEVVSGVAAQPFGDEETIRGARARAERALDADPAATLGIGLEGGVVELNDGLLRTCAWAAAVDREGRRGIGGSLAMPLPGAVSDAIRGGAELGDAMDRVTGETDVKRGRGAVGVLTAGLVDRQRAYEMLVAYALAPWLSPELWDARAGGHVRP